MDAYATLLELVRAQHEGTKTRPYPEPRAPLRSCSVTRRKTWTTIVADDGVHSYDVTFSGLNCVMTVRALLNERHADGTATYVHRGRAFRVLTPEDVFDAWLNVHHRLKKTMTEVIAMIRLKIPFKP